jgi:hypothetical protein
MGAFCLTFHVSEISKCWFMYLHYRRGKVHVFMYLYVRSVLSISFFGLLVPTSGIHTTWAKVRSLVNNTGGDIPNSLPHIFQTFNVTPC